MTHPAPAAAAAALAAAALAAQGPVPDPHWGASVYPRSSHELRLNASFDRFTEYSSSRTPGVDPPYNGAGESAGFNLFSLSYTDEAEVWPGQRATFTLTGGGGWSDDEPTQWLQNDYLHELRGLGKVPVRGLRESAELLGGVAGNLWFGTGERYGDGAATPEPGDWRWQGFLGGGIATSTIYHEPYVNLGGAVTIPCWNCRVGAVHRMSWPLPSDAYDDVAHFNNLTQLSLTYVPRHFYLSPSGSFGELGGVIWRADNLKPWRWPKLLHDLLGRPEVGVHVTYDTGLFVRANRPIETWFASVSLEWATGLRFETWNDFANGTDWGPTYGFAISFDVLTMLRRSSF